MKGKWLVTLVFLLALSGGSAAMAQSGDTSRLSGNTQSTNSMAGMDMSGSEKDSSMSGMDMSGSQKNNNMPGMDMVGSQKDNNMTGMDMGEGPVKETPANIKVLGSYGAVNLAFILIGVWNKWFRRKDVSNGNSK